METNKIEKAIYVHPSKPLEIKEFEIYSLNKPFGWIRIDLLKRRLKENKEYRNKFTKEELKQIEGLK